eukprot:1141959-Pelagomonas_calceolata.AAC.1
MEHITSEKVTPTRPTCEDTLRKPEAAADMKPWDGTRLWLPRGEDSFFRLGSRSPKDRASGMAWRPVGGVDCSVMS